MAYAGEPTAQLGWSNIVLGFAFILFDVAVSAFFGLGIERSLMTAAVRCMLQLAVMAVLLQQVFSTENPWAVAGIVFCLGPHRNAGVNHSYIDIRITVRNVDSSVLDTRAIHPDRGYALRKHNLGDSRICELCAQRTPVRPVYSFPTCSYRAHRENRDKVEMYLTFGASRMEACRPIAREALRLALTPVVNQMSVIGIIAIPGMMTGAILGGSSVEQAARLQMIIMFMISSATALASFFAAIAVIVVTVDTEHRVRPDRIDNKEFVLWRARTWAGERIVEAAKGAYGKLKEKTTRTRASQDLEEEQELLITSRSPVSPYSR
ncbi:hypothetical protein DXG01_001361 [Tephrocybe rancida]|nr:hypothetical protein DXG01_001361 [Tephrocybe rancida]